MALALSQIGLALSSGAFQAAPVLKSRLRTYVAATAVPKAALWWLLATSLVYKFVGLFYFVRALRLILRGRNMRDVQSALVANVSVRLKDYLRISTLYKPLEKEAFKEVRERM